MIEEKACDSRSLRELEMESDLVIVGGGLAGTCGAVTAARQGLKVVLVQDRPVLGGNSSSEVRLWILGATSHMGNNNRWAREGGVVNEVMEENLYRNREGNALIFDTILLEKVVEEENITLLLNTAAYNVEKADADTISAVWAFCSQNSTRYLLAAPLFCDASGDGILGFLSGAAFRMGAEGKEEFDEGFAPDQSYGELLGHSIYFYTKDTGSPVKYTAPSWALKDITKIPRYRQFNANLQGCYLWWIEYGGRLDTVHATEQIKWELWKVVYGVWDYIKNSGKFPEAETMTLEWVGHIPGKRESRRFEGDYMIHQRDVIGQTDFDDVVAHGGWSVDLHPSDGVYAEGSPCNQWHSKGVFGIPYRCYYSKNIGNLFLAGRIISASHVAFGTTRVMATCAAGAQAVAVAAALCKERALLPRDVLHADHLGELQLRLDRIGQFLPGKNIIDPSDKTPDASITASSCLRLSELKPSGAWIALDHGWAMILPLSAGACPRFTFELETSAPGTLRMELIRSVKKGNFTPDELVEATEIAFTQGGSAICAEFEATIEAAGYYFIKLCENPLVRVRLSDDRLTGIIAVTNAYNKAVATSSLQSPPEDIGVDTFEFWLPKRRPEGCNLAMKIDPPIELFNATNLATAPSRPTNLPNAWIAATNDGKPELQLKWDDLIEIKHVIIEFDPDWDHPMETVLLTHPEEVVPFMVKDFDLVTDDGQILAEVRDHHNARYELKLNESLKVKSLTVKVHATHGTPAAIFRVRVM